MWIGSLRLEPEIALLELHETAIPCSAENLGFQEQAYYVYCPLLALYMASSTTMNLNVLAEPSGCNANLDDSNKQQVREARVVLMPANDLKCVLKARPIPPIYFLVLRLNFNCLCAALH